MVDIKKKITVELEEDQADDIVVQGLKEDFEMCFNDMFFDESTDELKEALKVVLRHRMYYMAADAYIESIEKKYK